jgi:hypothetical protein
MLTRILIAGAVSALIGLIYPESVRFGGLDSVQD